MIDDVRIINTYDQNVAVGGDRIVIYFNKSQTGRMATGAKFSVRRYKEGVELKTEPTAPWYDYGAKTFDVNWTHSKDFPREGSHSQKKLQALAEAIAWVIKKYGPRVFVKNLVGDFVEKEVNDKFPIPKPEKKP